MPSTSSQFIYIGNLPDIDTDESDHDSENPNAVYGHYGNSEIENIIVTQTDDDGDGQLQTDDNNQSADTFTYDKGNGPETNALDSAGRYEVSYTDENGDVQSTVVSVYQTDNGDTFLKFPNGLQVRDVTVERIVGDGYTSITYGTSSSSVVVCFSADCEIDTLQGPRRIGDLAIGDRVLTLEHGCQEIRWLRTQTMPPDRPDDDAPILIAAHALGPNRPARDLIVSPQHRILVGGNDQMAAVFSGAALVPAKALTGWPGIRVMRGRKRMTWVHFACDAHEIVRVNGAYSETLLIGRMVLDTLSPWQKRMICEQYSLPDGAQEHDISLNGPAAKPCLTVSRARRHIALYRSAKRNKLIADFDADLAADTGARATRDAVPAALSKAS